MIIIDSSGKIPCSIMGPGLLVDDTDAKSLVVIAGSAIAAILVDSAKELDALAFTTNPGSSYSSTVCDAVDCGGAVVFPDLVREDAVIGPVVFLGLVREGGY